MKDKLIYIYPKKVSFINNDIHFLQKKYNVISQNLNWGSPIKLPVNFIRQLYFLVVNIYATKSIIVNFGGYFSLLPVLIGNFFNIKTFIILNGTDCVSFPKYNYGSLRKPILKFFIKNAYKLATKLLPVDESLIYQNYNFDDSVVHQKQGINAFFPNLKTPIKTISNGFDTSFWKPSTSQKKGFITVAGINNKKTFNVKGIDFILENAFHYPKENFTIIGISKKIIESLEDIPNNVKIIPFLKKEALKKEYQKHDFYIQVSINEGFGCALAEAMLCGCIPVISKVGALPNVTDNIGFTIDKKNTVAFSTVLNKIIKLTEEEKRILSKKARERIVTNFDISVRERLILHEIEN